MSSTSIEWTDVTWNPIRGCSVISPGCVNCYAMKQAHRFSGEGKAYEGLTKLTSAGPQWTGKVMLAEKQLLAPLSWRTPQRVFVNSMADLFHEAVPFDWIDKVFAVMALAPQHTFQVLTKRADRMQAYFETRTTRHIIAAAAKDMPGGKADGWNGKCDHEVCNGPWPLPNVWLGVSVENQKYADERIPLLLQTRAAVRFISYEPALGPIDLENVPIPAPGADHYGLRGVAQPLAEKDSEPDDWKYWTRHSAKLDWVIIGGESGPGARPFDVGWAWSIVKQCQAAGVACFVKQLGAVPIVPAGRQQHWDWQTIDRTEDQRFTEHDANARVWRLNLKDKKGGNSAEWMQGLRVRQFPEARA